MSDLVARSNPLLTGLTKRAMSTDRIWMRQKSASEHNARTILDGADVTIGDPASVRTAGVLDWSTHISEFKVPKRLLGQVVGNPAMIGELLYDEIKDSAADLSDKLAADIFGGDSANGISGMQSIFGTANTYAGIDRSVAANEYWRGLEVDAAGAALGTGIFYDAEEAFYARNFFELFSPRVSPTAWTSKRMQVIYKELFEQISYDSLGSAHFVNQANAGNQFGLSGVGFSGAPILPDKNIVPVTGDTADTNRMYIVDTSKLFLANLQPNDDSEVVRMQQLNPAKAPTTENIRVQIEILGNSGETVKGYIKTYCQLVCQAPPEAGVLIKNVLATR